MSLMLVDSAGLYFRAFYGVPDSVRDPQGRPVNAIRGFLDMVASLAAQRRPHRFVACLDVDWRPAFRVALLPGYKAHRARADGSEDIPAALARQVPVLLDILAAIGLTAAGCAGCEADDVMATLAARDHDAVEVVSGDRDLFGVVSDRVHLLYVGRGIAKMAEFGPDEVRAKYGIEPGYYADLAVLRGDPSDGLPGAAGIGERTAAALIERFGPIEAIVAAAQAGPDGFPAGARAKVLAAADYLRVAPGVVRMRLDADIEQLDDTIPTRLANQERLDALGREHGVANSIARLCRAMSIS
jgi:5'-3' exonuclease